MNDYDTPGRLLISLTFLLPLPGQGRKPNIYLPVNLPALPHYISPFLSPSQKPTHYCFSRLIKIAVKSPDAFVHDNNFLPEQTAVEELLICSVNRHFTSEDGGEEEMSLSDILRQAQEGGDFCLDTLFL